MADDEKGKPLQEVSGCQKCSKGTMKFLTYLPRAIDHPGYRIFDCSACGFIEWIAEKVG